MVGHVSQKNMFQRFLHSQVVGSLVLVAATAIASNNATLITEKKRGLAGIETIMVGDLLMGYKGGT